MKDISIRRIVATIIDWIIYLIIIVIIMSSLDAMDVDISSDMRTTFLIIVSFLTIWLIPSFSELIRGRTIGKKIMGIGVISDRFYSLNIGINLWRNLLKAVLSPISIVLIMLKKNNPFFHDQLSGTSVISK